MFGNYTLPNHDNGFQALQTMARESYTGPTFPGVVNSDLPLFAQCCCGTTGTRTGSRSRPSSYVPMRCSRTSAWATAHNLRRDGHGNESGMTAP